MYITYAFLNSIQMTSTICMCVDNVLKLPYYPQLSFCTLSTHMHIVDVICILFRNAYVRYMSSLLLLSVYVHVIYILSGHICIMCTLSEVVLDIFFLYILPWRICHPHPFWMTCHLHPFRMTCHLHSNETCLTSLKSEKQVTGQPDN